MRAEFAEFLSSTRHINAGDTQHVPSENEFDIPFSALSYLMKNDSQQRGKRLHEALRRNLLHCLDIFPLSLRMKQLFLPNRFASHRHTRKELLKCYNQLACSRIVLTVHESEGQELITSFRTPHQTSHRRVADIATCWIQFMRFQLLPQACLLLLAYLTTWVVGISDSSTSAYERATKFFGRHDSASGHTNNWAVLVCASRYWFNYRVRMTNAVCAFFETLRHSIWRMPLECNTHFMI